MSTISRPQNPEVNPRVKAVFNDIRSTRGTKFLYNLFSQTRLIRKRINK